MSIRRPLALAAGALFVLPVAPAAATETHTFQYLCKYPLIGTKQVDVTFTVGSPERWRVSVPTGGFPVTAKIEQRDMEAGFSAIKQLATIEGAATARATVITEQGFYVPSDAKLAVPSTPATRDAYDQDLTLTGTGSTASLTFDEPGAEQLRLDAFEMNLVMRDGEGVPIVLPPVTKTIDGQTVGDSDGDQDTFDVRCILDPGAGLQDPRLSTFVIGDGPVPTPGPLLDTTRPSMPTESPDFVPEDVQARSIVVRWGASTDEPGGSGLHHYLVQYEDQVFTVPADQHSYTLTGLTPASDYDVFITAVDRAGNRSTMLYVAYTTLEDPNASPTPMRTPGPATPTPLPTDIGMPTPTPVSSPLPTDMGMPTATPVRTPTPQTSALNYECKWPLIGKKDATAKTSIDLPSMWPASVPTDPFHVELDWSSSDMAAGLGAIRGLASIGGEARFYATVKTAQGYDVPAASTIPFTPTSISSPPQSSLTLSGSGQTPPLTFDDLGVQRVVVDRLSYNLIARDANGVPIQLPPVTKTIDGRTVTDSDGNPDTFDVYCLLTPGQNTLVGTFSINPGGVVPTSKPATPTPTVGPATPIGNPPSPLPATPKSPTPTPKPATPEPATPTPATPVAQLSYALQGSTKLATLATGALPLTGSVDASLVLATGAVTADLKLNDTQFRVTALGFLPVTVKVGFASSGPTTGKLVDDQLTTNSKVRIKVRGVKAFGAIPLFSGNACQTKQLSDITLKSVDAFDPSRGGTLAGTYAISDLNGCGSLNGFISPVTAGAGNTISVKLTPTPSA